LHWEGKEKQNLLLQKFQAFRLKMQKWSITSNLIVSSTIISNYTKKMVNINPIQDILPEIVLKNW
jgi:hypothetical protein